MSAIETASHVQRVVGVGADRFDAVRTRVELLARLEEPALLVPTRVSLFRADEVVVDEPARGSETLSAILDSRGALRAGECVWLGMAVAEALSVMHREGLAHGALDADAVVVSDGEVSLAHLVDSDEDASAPGDVAALGRLLAMAVRDADADRIRAWTDPMTHPDAQGRPTAAMVARALASCAAPEPLAPRPVGVATALRRALQESDDGGRAGVTRLDEARWWRARLSAARWAKRVGVPLAALGVVAGIIAIGVAVWPGGGGDASRPSSATQAGEAELAEAAGQQSALDAARKLTLARFDALTAGDGEALVALTAPGSPARTDAQATADALASGSLRVDSLAGVVEAADLTEAGSGQGDQATMVVRVRYRLGPHVVVGDGTATEYDGYAQTVDLTLVWVEPDGWLVSQADPVPQGETGTTAD